MSKMKYSGVEWLGIIPVEWKVQPLKYLYNMYAGGDVDFENYSVEKNEEHNIPIYSNSLDKDGLFGYTNRYRFFGNTFTVTGRGDVGKAIPRNEKFYPIVRLLVCVPKNKSDNRFYSYVVNSADLIGDQTAMAQLTTQKLGIVKVPIPSIKEQVQIADFLDEKISNLNNILFDLNKQIEILNKYKKSIITSLLIDQIGIKQKLKYLCKIQGRIGFKGYSVDDLVSEGNGALSIGAAHIKNNKIDLTSPVYISWEKYYESPEIMLKKNDILLVQRGSLGNVAILDEDIGKATINPSMLIIKDIMGNEKYIYYLMQTELFKSYIDLINTATAVPMISQTQLYNFEFILPSREKQDNIVKYLDKKCEQIDKIIEEKQKQIEKIEEYKKSVIYEYVTGKKRVEGAEELYG